MLYNTIVRREFVYDGNDRLVKEAEYFLEYGVDKKAKQQHKKDTYYWYEGNGVVHSESVVDPASTAQGQSSTTEYIRGLGGRVLKNVRDRVDFSGTATHDEGYYLYDGRGSVSGIVDGSGARKALYVYDAWGNEATVIGDGNAFRYNR